MTRAQAVHFYLGADLPLCGTYHTCNTLYAVDDQGQNRPEWVTCKKCLAGLGSVLAELARPGDNDTK